MPRFPSAQGRLNHEPDSTLAVTKTCPKDGVHLSGLRRSRADARSGHAPGRGRPRTGRRTHGVARTCHSDVSRRARRVPGQRWPTAGQGAVVADQPYIPREEETRPTADVSRVLREEYANRVARARCPETILVFGDDRQRFVNRDGTEGQQRKGSTGDPVEPFPFWVPRSRGGRPVAPYANAESNKASSRLHARSACASL